MTTKIDLDEIERKAKRLAAAANVVADQQREVAPCDAVSELGFARHEYDFAMPARVTLALVARIRELQDALRTQAIRGRAGTPRLLALLERGAVIP